MSDEVVSGPEGDAEAPISCGDSLDITQVSELHARLGEALAAGGAVVLQASAVERADAAALQLLCSFFREAAERGVSLRWESPSAALLDAARLLDLQQCLHLTES